jgi:hypothetical protein
VHAAAAVEGLGDTAGTTAGADVVDDTVLVVAPVAGAAWCARARAFAARSAASCTARPRAAAAAAARFATLDTTSEEAL